MDENLQKLIKETRDIIKKGWIRSTYNGYGGGGGTFEKAIGLSNNNLEIPDYNGIEIKTKVSNKENHITLFCSAPDSFLFEIQRIYNTYGYKNNSCEKSFNISVYTNKRIYYRENYYQLEVDNINKKIILCIYDKNKKLIDTDVSWSFNTLKEKIDRKINKLFLVFGERKYKNKEIFFKYNKYNYYVFNGFESFIRAIEKGTIRISFSIGIYKFGKKKGQIYDHGTSFNIALCNLEEIYTKLI